MNIEQTLYYSTVLIQAYESDKQFSIGTGFLFAFSDDPDDYVIVSNAHMVHGFVRWSFTFHPHKGSKNIIVNVDDNAWICHDSVDLAIFPLLHIKDALSQASQNIEQYGFRRSSIPTPDISQFIYPMANLFLLGYPDGITDDSNFLPIARKGIVSTAYNYDFNGKPQFLVDASIVGGSSGSPVFMLNKTTNNTRYPILLLGIVYKVYLHTIVTEQQSCVQIPNGLGLVLRAQCLLDLEPALQEYRDHAIHSGNPNNKTQ